MGVPTPSGSMGSSAEVMDSTPTRLTHSTAAAGIDGSDAEVIDKLELRAEGGRHHPDIVSSWTDDDAGKLEDKLTEIVIGLAVVSERKSRRWQAEMAPWERQREAEKAEAQRKAKEEEGKRRMSCWLRP